MDDETEDTELTFIRETFDWDAPNTPNVIANLTVSKISLDDMADILGCTVEEVKHNIDSRPALKAAYVAGPKFADVQITNRVYQQALNGDKLSQQLWINKRLSNKALKPDIIIKDDPVEMLRENIPALIQRGLELAYETDDLSKFNSYLNIALDRAYGKVIDKVEHSGNLTLDAIFASLPNTTGLPKREYIDASFEEGYNITPDNDIRLEQKDN